VALIDGEIVNHPEDDWKRSIGKFYWHLQEAPVAVFCIGMIGIRTLYYGDILGAWTTLNATCAGLGGKVSYYDDSLGPGTIGITPVMYYVWRPSAQSVVGIIGAASAQLEPWFYTYDWSRKFNLYYMAGASSAFGIFSHFSAPGGYYADVTNIADGDLLCVEYRAGRYLPSGEWSWLPWNKTDYPNSVDGKRQFYTAWGLPVGGSADNLGGQTALGGYRSFIGSTRDYPGGFHDPKPIPYNSAISVGF
jgi:hypothetical protein